MVKTVIHITIFHTLLSLPIESSRRERLTPFLLHHLACGSAPVAVVRVPDKLQFPSLQFLVQVVQQNVRQKRAERSALRRPFLRGLNHAVHHDSCVQVCSDQLQNAFVLHFPRYPAHQDVMIHPVVDFLQRFYNYERRQKRLNKLAPMTYRQKTVGIESSTNLARIICIRRKYRRQMEALGVRLTALVPVSHKAAA